MVEKSGIWKEGLGRCRPDNWQSCFIHMENLTKEWYERDIILYVGVEKLIISVGDGSGKSSSNESNL